MMRLKYCGSREVVREKWGNQGYIRMQRIVDTGTPEDLRGMVFGSLLTNIMPLTEIKACNL